MLDCPEIYCHCLAQHSSFIDCDCMFLGFSGTAGRRPSYPTRCDLPRAHTRIRFGKLSGRCSLATGFGQLQALSIILFQISEVRPLNIRDRHLLRSLLCNLCGCPLRCPHEACTQVPYALFLHYNISSHMHQGRFHGSALLESP